MTINDSYDLVQGYDTDALALALGWDDGIESTGDQMSLNYITNPVDLDGDYLVQRASLRDDMIGQMAGYADQITDKYSYGYEMARQEQPVYHNGSSWQNVLSFDTGAYI